MSDMQAMSHESSGLCWCGPDNHGPEKVTVREVLDGINARLAGATPGHWYAEAMGNHRADVLATDADGALVICEHAGSDATFIAAAPTDVARLTSAVDEVLRLVENAPRFGTFGGGSSSGVVTADAISAAIENALKP